MGFSDENLRYAKKWGACRSLSEFEALLARLECAENVVEAISLTHEGKDYTCECSTCDALQAWRKSKRSEGE